MADYGIDVSSFNTITNWSQVQGAGNSWAWSKATQGSGYTNPLYGSQMVSGRHAGLRMGAYHFPDPRVSVATQVRYFVGIARSAGAFDHGAFLPMLDMENDTADGITWSAGGANSFIAAFRDALRAATGQPMLCVYGPESWYSSGFLQPAQWADSGVFLCAAQYTGLPGQLGWSHPRLAVHQYTDSAPTPGAQGLTDRSVLVGGYTLADLTIGAGGFLMALTDAQEQTVYAAADALLPGQAGVRSAGSVFLKLDAMQQQLTSIQGALSAEEAELLAAIKALPAATVDVGALAKALADGGLPAEIVTALLAVLQKAAA